MKLRKTKTSARSPNPHSGDKAERRAWEKKLHAGPKMYPCPTCVARGVREPSMLSAKQKALGHQCNACADRDEGRYGNPITIKKVHRAKSIQPGSLLMNKQHPEWGVFTALHAERPGIWLIRSGDRRNETLLYPDEIEFWTVKPPHVTRPRGTPKHSIVIGASKVGKSRKGTRKKNPASQIKIPKQPKYFHITSVAKPKATRLPNPTMTGVEFRDRLLSLAKVGDRTLLVKATEKTVAEGNVMSLRSTDSVYVNFINLPKGLGNAGGGAEAENNRWMFSVKGFDRSGPVKVEEMMSPGRMTRLRAKTDSPEKIAKYLADHLTKISATVEPNFTHTRRSNPSPKTKRAANPKPRKGSGKPGLGILPPTDRRYTIRPEFTGHTSGVPQYVVRFSGEFVGSAMERRDAVKIQQQHAAARDRELRGLGTWQPWKRQKLEHLRVLPINHSASPRQPVALAEFVSGHLSRLERPLVLGPRCRLLGVAVGG